MEFGFEVEFIGFSEPVDEGGGSTLEDKCWVEAGGWAEEEMVELVVRVENGVVEADELGEVALLVVAASLPETEVYLAGLLTPSHLNTKELNATSAKHVPAGILPSPVEPSCLLPMSSLFTSPREGGFSSVGASVQFAEL